MFHVYSSIDKVEDKFNTSYENKFEINDEASLIEAVSHDYVCARYKDNKRSNANFICSDCITMDVDNDHSDNPDDLHLIESQPHSLTSNLLFITAEITRRQRTGNRHGLSSMYCFQQKKLRMPMNTRILKGRFLQYSHILTQKLLTPADFSTALLILK